MVERIYPAPGFDEEWSQASEPTAPSESYGKGYAPATEEDRSTRWGDYPRAIGVGTLGVASAIPTLAEYATQGEVGGDTRRYLEGKSDALTRGMTPVAKRSMNAAILPTDGQESIFDVGVGSSLGLQGASALPSVIASIIPGGLAARMARGVSAAKQAAIAGGVARGSAAIMNAGDVTQQIFSTLDDMSDDELYKSSPAFKGYIDAGLNPKEARGRFNADVAGVTPFLAGGISAILATPEAEMAANVAGVGVKKGLLKGALHGAIGEAKEEAVESGTGEFMTEQKLAEHNLGDRDWYNVLSKTVQGATIGAGIGGGTGGLTNIGGKPENQKIDADQQVALQGQTGSQPAAQPPAEVEAPPPPVVEPDVVSAQPPSNKIADLINDVNSPSAPADASIGPAGQAILNQRQAPLPDDTAVHIPPGWDEDQDAADALAEHEAKWADIAAGRNKPVSPEMEQEYWDALKDHKDQEALDAYDDYRAERNTEPDVTYGVGEEPEEEPEFAPVEQPSSSVQTDVTPEVAGAIKPKRVRRPAKQPAAQSDNGREANSIPQLNDDSATSRLKAATARIRNALNGRGRLKTSEVEVPIANLVSQQDWIEPSRKEPALATNEPPVVVHVGGKLVLRDGNHRVSAMIDRGDKTAKVRLVELDPYGTSDAVTPELAKKATRAKAPAKTKNTLPVPVSTATEPVATEPAEQPAPSGVIRPVYVSVAERLANKKRVSAEGSHEKQEKQAARASYAKAAEEAFYAHQPGDDEVYEGAQQIDLLRPKDSMTGSRFVRSDKQRKAIRARIEKFLKAVEGAGHEIPPYVTKNSSNHQLYARVAKDLLTYLDGKSKAAQEAVDNFITDEQAAYKGDFEPMRKRRLEEGDLKSRPNNELNEETTSGSNGGIGTQAFPAPDEMEDHIRDQRIKDMKDAARDIIARQRENTKSVDMGALYMELAQDYADVIDQLPMRSQTEVEAALREASAKDTAPKEKSGGAIKSKKAEPAPVVRKEVTKEENDRLVALYNSLEANKSQPKVYTPTRDIEELGRRLSIGAAGGMTQSDLRDALLGGQFGDYVSALIDSGDVVIHPTEATIPGGASQAGPIQGAVTPDGKIHLAANNLDAASANGVILHEVFHSRGQSLVGGPVWTSLMGQMANIVSAVESGKETSSFWGQAVRQAKAANTAPQMMAEEVAAYAIENAENATPGVRAFVARLLGAVKAWALKTFGVQFGKLTPEQLRSLAIAALRAKPVMTGDTRYSIGTSDVTDKVKDAKQLAQDHGQAFVNRMKRLAIAGVTLDQMRQTFKGVFVDNNGVDLLDKLVSTIQRMAPKAQKIREQSDELAQRFIALQKKDTDGADDFTTLANDATNANVRLGPDPTGLNNKHLKNGGRNAQGKELLDKLQERYKALSPEWQQLYQDMSAYYRAIQNEHVRGIVDNRLKRYGIEPANRAQFIEKFVTGAELTNADEELFKNNEHALKRLKAVRELRVIQGDYFPLMRYGKFVVNTNQKIADHMGGVEIEPGKVEFRAKTDQAARAMAERFAGDVGLPQTNWQKSPVSQANDFGYIVSVQTRGAHFFESEAEAIAWRRDHADEFDEISDVAPVRETGLQGADLTTAQLNSLQATVRNSNYSEEEKEDMLDMLQQGSAVLMSGNRIQKRSIARRKVMGASKDFGRNVVQYGEAVSNRLAQLEFRPEIDEALDGMRELNKNLMDKRQPERTALINEITKRIDSNVTGANEPGKFMKDLMTLTFLGKLASPMYSVINGMQPWMVTYPVLAGRYGPARAAAMLTQAYGSIGFSEQAFAGIKNTYLAGKNFNSVSILNTDDVVKSIQDKLKTQSDGAELSKVIDMLLERGAMSQGGFELAPSIAQGRGLWGSTLAKTDRIARQLPQAVEDVNRAVSAIAAYRLARASMSEEKAREFAFSTVMNTQGDYSGVNAPRFFNNPILRPAVQFKKYAQMMVYLLADMTHRAFGPNTEPKERKAAFHQLLGVMGVQIAMAGALSLPGIEIAKVGFMVASALGIGGGWDDEEEKLRKLADETFGKTWGELLTRGVVSRALNMDLSQRVSLSDMVTFGEPNSYDKDGLQSYLWQMATGAPGGTLEDVRHGITDAVNGDFGKAAGRIFPIKMISDAFKAANGYSEGKVTPVEAAMNIFGVKSGRQAEKSRETGNSIRNNEKIAASHKELTDAYLHAKSAGERVKLRAKIIEFNRSAPLRQKVFPNALDKVRQRIDAERVS